MLHKIILNELIRILKANGYDARLVGSLIGDGFVGVAPGDDASAHNVGGFISVSFKSKDIAEIATSNKGEIVAHRYFDNNGYLDGSLDAFPLEDPNCFQNLLNTLQKWLSESTTATMY